MSTHVTHNSAAPRFIPAKIAGSEFGMHPNLEEGVSPLRHDSKETDALLSHTHKIEAVQKQLDQTTDILRKDIQLALDNAGSAEEVQAKAESMKESAIQFKKSARDVKLHFCLEYYKYILIVVAVLAIVGVVIWLSVTNAGQKK